MYSRMMAVAGACVGGVVGLSASASGQVTLYTDMPTYAGAGGTTSVAVDFDSIAPGTVIDGQTFSGVTFTRLGSPLTVVIGASTSTPAGLFTNSPNLDTYVLNPTSGRLLLSPGGPVLGSGVDIDRDSMELDFATPVFSAAFDLAYQSADGDSFVGMYAYAADNTLIYANNFVDSPTAAGFAGATGFYGFVSAQTPIARIVIMDEDDDLSNPDANIGLDTVRVNVPGPGAAALLGLAGVMAGRRRR